MRFRFPRVHPPHVDSGSLTGAALCADEAAEAWSVMWVVFGWKCSRRWHNMTHCSRRQIINRRHYAHCLKNTHLNTQLSKHAARTCSLCLWESDWGRLGAFISALMKNPAFVAGAGWRLWPTKPHSSALGCLLVQWFSPSWSPYFCSPKPVPLLIHCRSGRKGQNN